MIRCTDSCETCRLEFAPLVRIGKLELDGRMIELRQDGRAIKLSPKELRFMNLMMQNPNMIHSHEMITHAVWGADKTCNKSVLSSIRTMAYNIRRQMVDDTAKLISRAQFGYGLVTGRAS